MRFDTEPIKKYDLSTLRVLGTVGEPINPEAWKWYNDNIGQGRASVVVRVSSDHVVVCSEIRLYVDN